MIPVLHPGAVAEDVAIMAPKASLEGLPEEIQSAVLLNIDNINSLKNLIHASPKYHSAYLGKRHAILEQVLCNSIPSEVLYDAFSVTTSLKTLSSNFEDQIARVRAFPGSTRKMGTRGKCWNTLI